VRILIVHNRYRSEVPSGENLVVDDEIHALRQRGHEVSVYVRSSDEIAAWSSGTKARNVLSPMRSRQADADVARLIEGHRPEVMHVHNLYPLISPSVIRVARERAVPVVQTVHNHRHTCIKGTYYRDGHICRDCLGTLLSAPAVIHACYRDSRLQSAIMASSHAVNRSAFGQVSRFIALTEEIAGHLREYGVPAKSIVVKPNSVPDPGAAPDHPDGGFVFVGRLSEEKGVALLCAAWRSVADASLGTLTVVGDGPLRHLVNDLAAERTDVRVLGARPPEGALRAIRAAGMVVIPSTCPDVFPRVAVEALGSARPIVATELGGLPSIVEPSCGWTCQPTASSLAATLTTAAATRAPSHSAAARSRYERHFAPAVVHAQLEQIYRSVMA